MNLRRKGLEVYKEEGLRNFLGKSLKVIGLKIMSDREFKKNIVEDFSEGEKYLNIGGGKFTKSNWRILDFFSESYNYDPIFVDINQNLEKCEKFPIKPESYDLVYSSHTLEHLSSNAVENTLEESYRILKDGGGIRINVPDVGYAIQKYKDRDLDWFRNIWMSYVDDKKDCRHPDGNFDEEYWLEFYLISFFASYLVRSYSCDLNLEEVRKNFQSMKTEEFLNFYSERITDEMHSKEPGWHRNWFTERKLKELLRNSGFSEIQERSCRKSRFTEMTSEEFDKRPYMSIYIEAEKQETK